MHKKVSGIIRYSETDDKASLCDALSPSEAVDTDLTTLGTHIAAQQNQIKNNLDQLGTILKGLNSLSEECATTPPFKFDSLIANIKDGVVITEASGSIVAVNTAARELLGLSGQSNLAAVQELLETLGLRSVLGACGQRESNHLNGEFTCKTAQQKVIQIKWAAVMDEQLCRGYMIIVRDATAQVDLDRAQTEFIAAISHELRTPLTTIQNSVSNMLAGVTGQINPKMHTYLKTMEGDCARLAHLVNDLLDMAKLEAGKMPITRTTVNLASVAEKAVQAFTATALQNNLRLTCHTAGLHMRVYADSARIYQVISNLLSNATKYTSPGGTVDLRIFEKDNEIVTVVEDTGSGIAADYHQRIFNKFYQVSRQVGPGYHGSGLGLALCTEILAMHGGRMWVESELGKGSKFYFSLPRPDSEMVLHKHVGALLSRAKNKPPVCFAVAMVRFNMSAGMTLSIKAGMDSLIHEIHAALDDCAAGKDDLIMQNSETEIILIVNQTGKHYLKFLKKRVASIINNTLANSCFNRSQIVPMLGISFYPDDGTMADELINKARREMNTLP